MRIVLFLILLAFPTLAQTPQPVDRAEKAKPADPLKLTDAELAEIASLANQQRETVNALQAKLNAVLTLSCEGCDKDALLLAAAKSAHEFYQATAKPLNQRIEARIAELQKAHGCEGCQLKEGAFVRPEGKAK